MFRTLLVRLLGLCLYLVRDWPRDQAKPKCSFALIGGRARASGALYNRPDFLIYLVRKGF